MKQIADSEEMEQLENAAILAKDVSAKTARAGLAFLSGDEERKHGVDYSKRVVAMCALAAALSYCDRTNMSVAIVSIASEMHWNDHDKSKVLGAFFWGYLFSQFAGAYLSQRYGGRQVLGVAALLWSILTFIMPNLARRSLGFLVFGRCLLGLAEGVTFPAIYYLLRQYVPQNSRSRSVAAISIGTMLGAIVSFLISPMLVKRYGWESVFTFFGGIVGPTLIVLWFHFVPTFKAEDTESVKDDESASPETPPPYLEMLRQPVLLSVFCAHFAHNLCHFALMSWLPLFLFEKFGMKGDSLALSALPWFVMALSVSFSSSYADRMIAGDAEVSTVRRFFTVASFTIAGTSMFFVALFTSTENASPGITLFFLCIALAANGSSTSGGYEAAKLDLSRSATSASRLQSLSNTLATLAGVVGIPLVPFLKGHDNHWERVFLGLSASFLVAALIFHTFGRWTHAVL